MADPPVLLSMFFGAPLATGLLRASLIEAGAAGAGEALAQVAIQSSRRQFGEELDIGAEVRPGVRALLKRAKQTGVQGSLAKAAARFLRRQVELEDASPLHDAPAARAEHAARMSEAQVAPTA